MRFSDYCWLAIISFCVLWLIFSSPKMTLNTVNGAILVPKSNGEITTEDIVFAFSRVQGDFVKIDQTGKPLEMDVRTIATLDEMGWEMVTEEVFRKKPEDSGIKK
jgi:hypothetical protein